MSILDHFMSPITKMYYAFAHAIHVMKKVLTIFSNL